MCGIMGYIGDRNPANIVYSGLRRLEYRGYDSVGIAVLDHKNRIRAQKTVGDTSNLDISSLPEKSLAAIGHTRWATHGKPSTRNAHPHIVGDVCIVHNGIIENYQELKKLLPGIALKSDTDSEVLAALIQKQYTAKRSLLEAVRAALSLVKGTFGLVVMSPREPDELIVARRGSPIVIGVGEKQMFIASDPSALTEHTDKVVYLEDDQIGKVSKNGLEMYDLKLHAQATTINTIENENISSEKGSFKSYLEKEIFEQPLSLQNVMRGRVLKDGTIKLGGPNLSQEDIEALRAIILLGCGTSYYAGLYAKYKLEEMLGIPVVVEHASEFRYRYGAYDTKHSVAIFLSQSGETADLLASLQEAKRRSMKTMGVVNTVGSSIAREVDHGGIYLHAGQEVSVASTKAYSSMTTALLMLGAQLASKRGMNSNLTKRMAHELLALPQEFSHTLMVRDQIKKIVPDLLRFKDWYYLGRNELYPVALEGALKLTELCYIHAQALPAGEMKHGPIALVDNTHLSVLLLPEDEQLYEKGLSTLEELSARNGNVLTISTRSKPKGSNYHVEVSHIGDYVDGLVYNVVLQLLALEIASAKKLNIDKPRNLAKSVTVE